MHAAKRDCLRWTGWRVAGGRWRLVRPGHRYGTRYRKDSSHGEKTEGNGNKGAGAPEGAGPHWLATSFGWFPALGKT